MRWAGRRKGERQGRSFTSLLLPAPHSLLPSLKKEPALTRRAFYKSCRGSDLKKVGSPVPESPGAGGPKKSANQGLYRLLREGKVWKSEGPPLLWSLPALGSRGSENEAPKTRPGKEDLLRGSGEILGSRFDRSDDTQEGSAAPQPLSKPQELIAGAPGPTGKPAQSPSLSSSFQRLALGEGSVCSAGEVLEALEALGPGQTALQVARKLGATKKVANHQLYCLEKQGAVSKNGETPPRWSLATEPGEGEGERRGGAQEDEAGEGMEESLEASRKPEQPQEAELHDSRVLQLFSAQERERERGRRQRGSPESWNLEEERGREEEKEESSDDDVVVEEIIEEGADDTKQGD
ncbi:double-stranded RNA-specific adenosine deaminase [Huso huso]|uniref:Double-stranded RNA-specific adenosine deaminase n=1 Tax=Huso huso TaxID=61971 RepID=A0ABR0Y461_HUSHU